MSQKKTKTKTKQKDSNQKNTLENIKFINYEIKIYKYGLIKIKN
jgi:hypothetical protein